MPATFPIHLFEEHSASLPIWWQNRASPCTAVYLDAHLDLQQISEEQLQSLKNCDSLDEFKALEAPHHLIQNTRYAYGIENFLYPASQLKLIDRLIWVVPPHIPRSYNATLLEYIQQMDGISFEELSGFVEVFEGVLRGQLLGLDITICEFHHLHKLNVSNHYYLDIDIDYFVKVPEDRLWVDPGQVVEQVLKQLGAPVIATVSRAVSSGHTPLSLRFVGDYVTAVIAGEKSESNHFHQLYLATLSIEKNQTEKAISLCQQAITTHADCAASHYLLGKAMNQADITGGESNIKHAMKLDDQYNYDLSREASSFPNRHRELHSDQLNLLATQLNTRTFESKERCFAEIAIGLLYAEHGMLKQAWELLQKQSGELADHCDLLMAIARGVLASNEPYKAKQLLELATKDIKTRTGATMLIGDLAFMAGNIKLADEFYLKTSGYAPAWMAPLERRLFCLERLDERDKLNTLKERIEQRKQVLSSLIIESRD